MIPETDEVIVNRNGTTYKTTAENMANLEDNDLMLVNRDGVTYTVTGQEVKDSIQSEIAPNIEDVVLTQNQVNANRYTNNSFTTTVDYTEDPFPPAQIEMTAEVKGVLGLEATTDFISSNNYPGTDQDFITLGLASDTNLANNVFEVGDEVKANEAYTPTTSRIESVTPGVIWSRGGLRNTQGDWTDVFNGTDTGGIWACGPSTNEWVSGGGIPPITGSTIEFYVRFREASKLIVNGSVIYTANNVSTVWVSAGTSTVESFAVERNGDCFYQASLSAVRVDGVILSDTPTVVEPEDDTDIHLFQEGDKVQQLVDTSVNAELSDFYTPLQPWSSYEQGNFDSDKMFNGNPDDYGMLIEGTATWQAPEVIPVERELRIKWGSSTNGSGAKLNGMSAGVSPGAAIYSSDPASLEYNAVFAAAVNSVGGLLSLQTTYSPGVQSQYIYFIQIDGKTLLDPALVSEASVISTDVANKTLTLDGGLWDLSNQDEVWSQQVVGTPYPSNVNVGPFGNLFDGKTDTYTAADTDSSCSWTAPANSTYEIYFQKDASAAPLKINGSDYNGSSPATGSNLTSVEWSTDAVNQWVKVSAIKLDGVLLVDAANESQAWSASGGIDEDGPLLTKNVFDGKLDTNLSCRPKNTVITLGDGTGVIATQKVRFYGSAQDSANTFWQLNGVSTDAQPPEYVDNDTYEWREPTDVTYPINIQTFGYGGTASAGAGGRIVAIEVDGLLLIDKGYRELGDNTVSTVNPKQGTGTISDVAGTAVTINPFDDNCFKVGQYLTHVTPKPVLITPKTDDITDVSGDLLTFSGNTNLLNFAAGDTVSMVNADGSAATYNAETSAITSVADSQPVEVDWTTNNGWNGPGSWFRAPVEDTQAGAKSEFAGGGLFNFSPGIPNVTKWEVLMDNNFDRSGTHSLTTSQGAVISASMDRGTGKKWNLVYDNPAEPVTIISYSMQTQGPVGTTDGYAFRINGTTLLEDPGVQHTDQSGTIVLPAANDKTLTFTDDTDLQYFNDGDVVQSTKTGIVGEWTDMLTAGPASEADKAVTFDGDTSTKVLAWSGNGGSLDWKIVFNPPLEPTIQADIYCNVGSENNSYHDGRVTVNDSYTDSGASYSGQWVDCMPGIGADGKLYSIRYQDTASNNTSSTGYYPAALRIDGELLYVEASQPGEDFVVVGTPQTNPAEMIVSGGSWSAGDTVSKNLSGTGTVASVDAVANTLELATSNNQWVVGYYAQTPEKPAVEQTGYLIFGSNGNVTGVSLNPQPVTAMVSNNPVLTFPEFFGTGQTPDLELPFPTSIKTNITAKNTFFDGSINSDSRSSNVLFPDTTTFLAPAAGTLSYTNTGNGVAQLTANLTTFSGREAEANTDPTDVQGALAAKQTEIDDYIAGL